jgi:4a-hydroxytetrahydrobiopterin dehydratase
MSSNPSSCNRPPRDPSAAETPPSSPEGSPSGGARVLSAPAAQAEIGRRAATTPWSVSEDGRSLSCEWRFADFSQAFAFMVEMALVSERMNHHPEWFNVYNRVRVRLSTHDAGGLTALDLDWAEQAAHAAARRGC